MAPPRNKSKFVNTKPSGKPDLLHVLERRRRTVQVFLEEQGVKNLAGVAALLENYSKEYDISEEFVRQAEAFAVLCQSTIKNDAVAMNSKNNEEEHTVSSEESIIPEEILSSEEKPKKRKKSFEKMD